MTLSARKISDLRNGDAETHRRAERGVTRMKNSTAMMPTTVAPKTDVGAEIREKVGAALLRFPTKSIESGGDLTNEGVRLLKNGRRTISTETLIKLAHAKGELGPAIWSVICELCGRPGGRIEHESPRLSALFGALSMIARSRGPEGAFATALIKQMNAEEAPERESAAIHDLFERRRA